MTCTDISQVGETETPSMPSLITTKTRTRLDAKTREIACQNIAFGCPCVWHVCFFPGHALHEEGLQRQIGVGTLVSSRERSRRKKTVGKPLANRLFCSSTGLHRIYFVRACEETFKTVVYNTPVG